MRWHHWAFLLAASASGHAEAQAHVRDTTLPSLRLALEHYDVAPGATAAQLPLLAQFARDHAGTAEAEEARFLRAAVASDLSFLAALQDNAALTAALAQSFGAEPAALHERIEQALQEAATGMYSEPAAHAIEALRDSAAPGVRSDARLVQRALTLAKSAAPRAGFAAVGQDPCAAQPCAPDIATLDADSRVSFGYLNQVAEAEARLIETAALGDPLAEAVVSIVRETRRTVPPAPIQFLPDVGTLASTWPGAMHAAPGELHKLVFVGASELSYASVQQARIGAEAISFERPAHVFPGRKQLPTVALVAEWVHALRNAVAGGSVGVVAAPGVPGHVLGRVLVALREAGVQKVQLLGRNDRGQLEGIAAELALEGPTPPKPADLTLRVRAGGYGLRMGERDTELPRLRAGARYDRAGLAKRLQRGRFQTVAVSFVDEITAEALLEALAQLPRSAEPVQLLLRNAL